MKKQLFSFALIAFQIICFAFETRAQIAIDPIDKKVAPKQIMPEVNLTIGLYLDLENGTTVDESVRIALENNGEIAALRDELKASKALIKQSELKPNPRLNISGSQEGIIGNRYSGGVSASLPLELGGRRGARIAVAESEFRVRESLLVNSERILAADVRLKFGETLASIEKLKFLEELLANVEQGYKLIKAKVGEGRTAPLEQSMSLVELNRMRSMREIAAGNVEIKLLELRNLMGIEANQPLRLKGDFENLLVGLPPLSAAVENAVANRPDLESARLTLELGNSRLEQARAEGRLDAGVSLGFQRMTRITPRIINQNPVELEPRRIGENFITFGVDLTLPVRNKNQGNIESAALQINAANKRLEFGELTVRREVAAAYTRYERAVRALTIYQSGVRNQAKINLNVVWQTYELGEKDLLDYIAEERRFLDLENSLVDALLEVYQANTEILRATSAIELVGR